jgi:hypothetical protein
MHRTLKQLHLLGLVAFLGSIFGHIALGVFGGAPGDARFAFAREAIVAATRAVTMPGLGLAVGTGVLLVVRSKASFSKSRWLAVHAGLALVIGLVAATVIVPSGARATAALARGALEVARAAVSTETIAGAVNMLLTLAVVVLGVFKPRLRGRARTAALAGSGEA